MRSLQWVLLSVCNANNERSWGTPGSNVTKYELGPELTIDGICDSQCFLEDDLQKPTERQ